MSRAARFGPTLVPVAKPALDPASSGLRLAHASARPMDPPPTPRVSGASLSDRIRALCAGKTPQTLARMTGSSADSVRRYLRGAAAPPDFLVRLAGATGVSLNWMLSGRGPIRRSEVLAISLERASTTDLLGELARRLGPTAAAHAA
jgi:hypothetical protein